jgi:hypothetical protein
LKVVVEDAGKMGLIERVAVQSSNHPDLHCPVLEKRTAQQLPEDEGLPQLFHFS